MVDTSNITPIIEGVSMSEGNTSGLWESGGHESGVCTLYLGLLVTTHTGFKFKKG